MRLERKTNTNQADSEQINFRVTDSQDLSKVMDCVSELREQILVKSNIPRDIADRMIEGKGCSAFLNGGLKYDDRLDLLQDSISKDDAVIGFARYFYPPIAIGSNYDRKMNAGRYILAASLIKFSEAEVDRIRRDLENRTTLKKSESIKLSNKSDFYQSVNEMAKKLLMSIVVEESSPDLIRNIEAHFAKFNENKPEEFSF